VRFGAGAVLVELVWMAGVVAVASVDGAVVVTVLVVSVVAADVVVVVGAVVVGAVVVGVVVGGALVVVSPGGGGVSARAAAATPIPNRSTVPRVAISFFGVTESDYRVPRATIHGQRTRAAAGDPRRTHCRGMVAAWPSRSSAARVSGSRSVRIRAGGSRRR
jgi:hypothetical protein